MRHYLIYFVALRLGYQIVKCSGVVLGVVLREVLFFLEHYVVVYDVYLLFAEQRLINVLGQVALAQDLFVVEVSKVIKVA